MHKPPLQLLLATAILIAAVLLRIWDPAPVARLRLAVFDTYLRLAPRIPDPSYPVKIVDIDEASLARAGQWPWPRTRLAEIIARLQASGAKSVTLDLILAEPDRMSPEAIASELRTSPGLAPLAGELLKLPANDARLAAALDAMPSVLGLAAGGGGETAALPKPKASLAHAGDDPALFAPSFPRGTASLPALTEKARGLGAVNWLPEDDQIVRRVPLLVSVAGTLYPSLSLEALRVGGGDSTIFVKSSGGSGILSFGQRSGIESVRTAGIELPTGPDGQMWLRQTLPDPNRYLPAWRILDGSVPAADVAGRHILIGTSAAGLLDLRATPLSPSVPGVEIHAQALEQMLSGDHPLRPAYATGLEIAFLLASGALIAWLIARSGAVLAAVVGASSIASVLLLSWLAYTGSGVLLDPVYPSLALGALYTAGSLVTYVRSEIERTRIRGAFSHYVAPSVVDELTRNPDKLKLGGETREVTILFADVRGFSRLSEGMSAEELIGLINRLFTPLSEIILDTKGTIDKYMGDAVMAFWNAPLADAAHAGNAARAALRMIEAIEALAAGKSEASGASAESIRIGIGLNTGSCAVGNMGSPERFDYSILGDAVNVASRLQEATKIYGVPIIAGEATARQASHLAFLEIDTLVPRGKGNPERIFALLGDEALKASPKFASLSAAHGTLLEALRAKDAKAAARQLDACRKLGLKAAGGLLAKRSADVAALAKG